MDDPTDDLWGREIKTLTLSSNNLEFEFTDGVKAQLSDRGQSCCENRYITCDDELGSIVGGIVLGIEQRNGGDISGDEFDVHDVMFVEVKTTKGFVTLTTHNQHNGYYGGFDVQVKITHRPLSTMRLPQ